MSTIEKALEKLGKKSINESSVEPSSELPSEQTEKKKAIQTASTTSRRLSLDLDLLARKGYLTPGSGRTQLAEEMRHIKRPLLLNAAGVDSRSRKANLIMVTSSRPSEGKSYISLNLAMSIAKERDKTVLLVDADVAKPGVTRVLGVVAEKGLVDYLVDDDLDLADVMLRTNVPNFRFFPAGRRHIHSTEFLASDGMKALVEDLATRYHDRIVIFDSPPLLATSEAAVVASLVGQILMVVEAEKTSKQELDEALSLIDQSNKNVGLVLNKARGSFGTDYYGYYGGYGD